MTFVTAADSLRIRFGVHAQIGSAFPSLRYYGTPGIPNCCSEFTTGSGSVYGIGALTEIPLSQSFFLGIRGSFTDTEVLLNNDENTIGLINNTQGVLTFNHTFTANFPGITLSSLLGWKITSSLFLSTGPGTQIITSPTFSQKESIAQGTPGTFIDGKRIRNEYAGTMTDARSFAWDWNIIAGYDLPLDSKKTFFLTPELHYSLALQSTIQTSDNSFWRNSSLRGGISFKYSPYTKPVQNIIPPPKTAPPPPPIPVPTPPIASLSVEIVAHDGSISKNNIKIEEFISTEMYPLLRYIFFDELSSDIPTRYHRTTAEKRQEHNERSLAQNGAMSLYYHILDIIGKRMTEYPTATITLTGCISGSKEEVNNSSLAQQRTETVANYLIQTWGISAQRIKKTHRGLPATPANTSRPEGLEENRRVEINSDDKRITDPVIITDTVIQGSVIARFSPIIQAKEGLKEWKIIINRDNKLVAEHSHSSEPNTPIEYRIIDNQQARYLDQGTLHAELTVTDKKNQTVKVTTDTIPYSVLSISNKRKSLNNDKEFDTYRLLLFGYDQFSLSEDHKRSISFIQQRIHNGATIIVRGSTDNIGDTEYNKTLSLQRAKESVKALGLQAEAIGIGTTGAGYDNTLPEGRFYNRTVEILVTNPVN